MSRYNRLVKSLQAPAYAASSPYRRKPHKRFVTASVASPYRARARFVQRPRASAFRGMASRGRGGTRSRHYIKNPGGKVKNMVEGPPTLLDKIASGVGSVAKLATAVAPMLAMINTEAKYYDETNTFSTYVVGTNNDIRCLTDNIDQSLTSVGRIGDSVLCLNFQIRVALTQAVTTTILGGFHRILIFAWKDDSTANPPLATCANVLEAPTNIYSPLNKDYSDQIVVLKDKHIAFNSSVIPTTGTITTTFKTWKFYKQIDWHLRWTGATGSTTKSTNHIWMITMSSPVLAGAIGTTYYSRINYTDN